MAVSSQPESAASMRRQRGDTSRYIDTGFIWLTGFFAISIAIILFAIAIKVTIDAWPAIQTFGVGFIFSSSWDPVNDVFGAAPQLYGTLVTAILALLLAVPVGVGVAIFLNEDFLPDKVKQPIVFMVELLAAIPSVVYGIWGIFVLIPALTPFGQWLHENLGWIPIFSTPPETRAVYVAGLVLAIMILPIIAAISRDSLAAVPNSLRQAAYGLGATRWEAIFKVMLPAGFSGIIGGVMLALGRALGETMAVTMVIGNTNRINASILTGGSTVASLLANNFAEASGLQISALMYAAILLFLLTLLVNIFAEYLVRKVSIKL